MSKAQSPLFRNELIEAVSVLRAVNHPVRRRIISLLYTKGPMNVTAIYTKLKLEQSDVSAHLRLLRQVRIVAVERQKKSRVYRLYVIRLSQINVLASELVHLTSIVEKEG
jgi:DNA-binding transcriptional ArsR family regulator